ncbi:GINS complex, subunit Psf1 [Kalmanozyma brasiliensis GHG001]|uniref:GINS complex, subunit Psf1 n=1 Tax=Kalmanozyma brasiliensis (strain GHG001) TaxID=1365824 RepID=UPI0028683953|nr:GINS complex, subunit Psf1 [Kalmanozyma brasiliensis GHG001]KAF6766900.1 GINS complex, subunit Psf1 [Kalmanozyma brasiliensis GHG001]
MFGDSALKLATEAKACLNLDTLKPYNDDLIRLLVLETKQLHAHLTSLLTTLSDPHLAPSEVAGLQSQLLMLHLIVGYNRRALLLYHNTRLDLVCSHLARHSSLAILLAREPGLRTSLSPAEQDSLRRYAELLQRGKMAYLDLSPGLRLDVLDGQVAESVPTELLVTVKVERDLKDVWLSSNQVAPTTLRKDQTVTIARSDVRGLIGRGWVSVVDGSG